MPALIISTMAPDKKQFYLLKSFNTIPLDGDENGWLGRVVRDYDLPLQNYLLSSVSGIEYHKREFPDFSKKLESTKSTSLKGTLLEILGGEWTKRGTISGEVKASTVTHYWMSNVDQAVLQLKEKAGYQQQLDDWLTSGGAPVYMIVGYLVAENIQVAEAEKSERQRGPNATLPAAVVSAAAGVPLPVDVMLVDVSGRMESTSTGTLSITVGGKAIFAVQYRSLRKAFFTVKRKVGFGPQGPRSFGDVESEQGQEDIEQRNNEPSLILDSDPILNVLEDVSSKEIGLEDYDEFSFVFDEDAEDDGDDDGSETSDGP
jgi:hypothetical protein